MTSRVWVGRVKSEGYRALRAALSPSAFLALHARLNLWTGEPELRLLPKLVDPKRVALDVGANRGVYSWHLCRLARSVVAFEPNPEMASWLRRAAPRAEVRVSALSDREGATELRMPDTGSVHDAGYGYIGEVRGRGSAERVYQVRTTRLDDSGLEEIGFIKIDVEGHEAAVIEGGRATIERDLPVMLIEVERRHTGRDPWEILDPLVRAGYRTVFLEGNQLRPLGDFDPARHQAGDGRPEVNNFILLPPSRDDLLGLKVHE